MHVMVHKFKKVLVANRGEIAIRVFRALEELNIGSIAVYSKEDRYALFRTKADEAYPLDPDKGPVDAYLDIQTIIRIAKEKKADAIHPGYGFLSESPDFAEACRKNGIVFIGPTVESMNIMGDKLSAKQAAHDSNVPIISGSDFILPGRGDSHGGGRPHRISGHVKGIKRRGRPRHADRRAKRGHGGGFCKVRK